MRECGNSSGCATMNAQKVITVDKNAEALKMFLVCNRVSCGSNTRYE